jgi:hypothetical protein
MEESSFQRRIRQYCACLVAFVLIYLASYAPYIRFRYGADRPHDPNVICWAYDHSDAWENETSRGFYVPVEWLIDHTSASRPIFWWADVCGAAVKSRYDATMRCYEQQL